jgi:curved DNA-binding protein CbpA
MSYYNITKQADTYLNQIKNSENRVADILAGFNRVHDTQNKSGSINKYKELEMEFIKEYIKKQVKKIKSANRNTRNSAGYDTSGYKAEKKNIIRVKSVEQINKSVQVELLNDTAVKFSAKSEDDITQSKKFKHKIKLPTLNPTHNTEKIQRAHSRPRNPSEFMKNYYKYHVKLHFSPTKPLAHSATPSKKSFNRVKLFNIVE